MKKLFVSVPMKGRTTAEIKASTKKMHKIAEAYVEEELELLDSFVEDGAPLNTHPAIWYLGKALEKLAEADIFIGISNDYIWSGCAIEREAANSYGITCYRVDPEVVIDNYDKLCETVFGKNSVSPSV